MQRLLEIAVTATHNQPQAAAAGHENENNYWLAGWLPPETD